MKALIDIKADVKCIDKEVILIKEVSRNITASADRANLFRTARG